MEKKTHGYMVSTWLHFWWEILQRIPEHQKESKYMFWVPLIISFKNKCTFLKENCILSFLNCRQYFNSSKNIRESLGDNFLLIFLTKKVIKNILCVFSFPQRANKNVLITHMYTFFTEEKKHSSALQNSLNN